MNSPGAYSTFVGVKALLVFYPGANSHQLWGRALKIKTMNEDRISTVHRLYESIPATAMRFGIMLDLAEDWCVVSWASQDCQMVSHDFHRIV